MSTGSRRDVQLVIRARDEGSKAIEAVSGALQDLFASQENVGDGATRTGSDLVRLVSSITALEGAYKKIDSAANRADGAFSRQQTTLAETKAQLAAVKSQIEGVARAIEAAQTKIVDAKLGGVDTGPLIAQIKAAQGALAGLEAQQIRLTGSVRAQESALGQSRSSLQQLGSIANAAEAALIGVGDAGTVAALKAKVATDKTTAALREQAQAAREAVQAQAAQGGINSLLGVRDIQPGSAQVSAAFFDEQIRGAEAVASAARSAGQVMLSTQVRAAEAVAASAREAGLAETDMATRATALRAQIDPLANIQANLNLKLKDARDLYRAGKIEAHELAAAEKILAHEAKALGDQLGRRGRGEAGKPALFGLKPYELTNLGYQVNDVFTQLASGTSLTQTLAQQGGQLLQLFPKLGSTMIAALGNPVVIGAAATFGAISLSVKKVVDTEGRMRTFGGSLEAMGENAGYSAEALSDTSARIDRLGTSAEEAVAIVRTFMREGVDPSRLEEFALAAKNAADVLGVDLKDAAQQMAVAFTAGYDAVAKLDDAQNFLSATEREHIRLLFASGEAARARTEAVRIYTEQMNRGAELARGPWTQAARNFEGAWTSLLETLGKTAPIRNAAGALGDLARLVNNIAAGTDGVRNLVDVTHELAAAQAELAFNQGVVRSSPNGAASEAGKDVIRLEARIRALKEEKRLLEQIAHAGVDPQAQAARIKYENDATAAIELQRQTIEAVTDAQKIRAAGEQAYREEIQATGNTVVAEAKKALAIYREEVRIRRDKAREAERERAAGITDFQPSVNGKITGKFGEKRGNRLHQGVDRRAVVGTPVTATAPGTVIEAGTAPGFGNYVLIDHGKGTTTRVAHLSRIISQRGDFVTKGQTVGLSGGAKGAPGSGNSQGPHVHEQIEVGGKPVDPTIGRFPTDKGDAMVALRREEERRLEQQERLNERIDDENAKREQGIVQARRMLGLSGEEMFAEQRRQTVEDAVFAARQEAGRQELTLSDERKRRIEETVGAEWDLAHARERATSAVDASSAERQALLDTLQTALDTGDSAGATRAQAAVDAVDAALRSAIDSVIAYWKAWDTPESRTAVLGLESLRRTLGQTQEDMRRSGLEKPLDQMQGQRSGLMEQIQFFRDQGQMGIADQLRDQLSALDAQLLVAIDRLIAFWQVSSRPEAAATIVNLQNLRNQVVAAGNEFAISAGQVQQAFAGSMTSAVTTWAQAVGEGRNVLRSTWDMAKGFAADFLQKLAQMALQAAALKIAMKIGFGKIVNPLNGVLNAAPLILAGNTLDAAGTKVVAGGVAVGAASVALGTSSGLLMAAAQVLLAANAAGSASIFHSGGIVGTGGSRRDAWPGIWANAARFHTGGVAGLRPREIPAILERGEEVLTRGNPRHILNGGGMSGVSGGEPTVDIKNITVFDPSSVLSQALQSRVGQRVLINYVRQNAGAMNSALRG